MSRLDAGAAAWLLGVALAGAATGCGTAGTPQERTAARRAAETTLTFDSRRAFEHIRQLVTIGPRPPGSPGSQQARRYITAQLEALGLTVVEQRFQAQTPYGVIGMTNLIVRLPGTSGQRLIIGGHYDTKLFRQFRFVGANDGGSSTAVLIELARALGKHPRLFTIELVFFDGEEALVEWTADDHTYGSRRYVSDAGESGTLKDIRAMLLVDMVGDRDLRIRRESLSTAWLTDIVWSSAQRLGHGAVFLDEPAGPIQDDHVAFLTAGIPAVNIIDLQYAAWHTPEDTLDYVSAGSLQIVGDVVLHALPRIEARLTAGRAGR